MAVLQTWASIVASTLRSDKDIRENLQDAIYNVTPAETPFLSRLQQVAVTNNHVQWQTDTYRDAATNAQLEGIAYTSIDCTVPSRADNTTQNFYESLAVSDRNRATLHAGFDDPFVYQETKKLVGIKRDVELALVKGSAATGTTGTASQLGGLMNIISTNNTSMSGITLTETVFNNLLELVWTGSSVMPNEIFVGPKLRRTISLYSTKVTPFIMADQKKQILTTKMYDSDFGEVVVNLHRDLNSNGSTTENEMLIVDPNWFATGWLQPLRREVLPRDGKRDRGQISCDLTLLYRNEKSAVAVTRVMPYIA